MNKMIVRGATAVLALCLASPALAACGDSKKSDDGDKATAAASPSSEASSKGTDGSGGSDSSGGAQPGTGSSPKPQGGVKSAVKLPVPDDLSGALQDTYFAAAHKSYPKGTRADVLTPTHVLFGKITGANGGVQFYAAGDIGFKNNPISQQDGPHVWKKDDSQQSWVYVSDTGGNLCGSVPKALVQAWGRSCN
ncbi:hypothetical protein DZF91_04555 [Actinomadura logoneensis]|uniref:Lipoprotein n=1 Tax=Actinomadura logoneensis TaxID=2293572 RepID=A0A372JRZ7_9ACTN|nr:hypothetical protein [Actinomadura logoneensis]RFU42791.1 hypothetical protein DZF91_04555 [Actinomadura logoneensis]